MIPITRLRPSSTQDRMRLRLLFVYACSLYIIGCPHLANSSSPECPIPTGIRSSGNRGKILAASGRLNAALAYYANGCAQSARKPYQPIMCA